MIPAKALDRHIGILGMTGSGKTSAAKVAIVEPALAAGERVLIIDPTAAWWGLRIGAARPHRGFPIYIFGGEHGDYPLRAADAVPLAEAFATSSDSAIFDTSQMTVSERTAFFTEFAEAIRRKNRGPLKLIIDEAHLFMPQQGAKAGGAVPAMLHAGNNLVSLGRSRGLRITLISQRPAKLHKDSLTQVQSLVAMRLMAPQDRKAISEWIADQADPSREKEIIASLPALKPGTGWVWSPMDEHLALKQFPMPSTFDSSRAPTADDEAGPTLTPINLDALKGRLGKLEAERKANDPAALRRRIAELEAQATAAPSREAIEEAERNGFDLGFETGVTYAAAAWSPILRTIKAAVPDTLPVPERPKDRPRSTRTPEHRPIHMPEPAAQAYATRKGYIEKKAYNGDLGPERRPLAVLAAVYPAGMTEAQWATAAGMKRTGGTWNTYKSRLRTAGMIDIWANGQITATPVAMETLGDRIEPMPAPGPALVDFWAQKVGGAGPMLRKLADFYPNEVSRQRLAEHMNMTPTGGTFNTYLSRLRSPGLIEERGKDLRCSPNLMGR